VKKSVKDIDVAGKTVLVRVDFNLPLDKNGGIADDSRLRAALPTIWYLQAQKAKTVLCSHFGRPDGKVVESMRLGPVGRRLGDLLDAPVKTLDDCIGPAVKREVESMAPGEVILLENVRFHAEEEKNDPAFAKELASLAGVFVNDAFGTAHRAHASTVGVASYLPAVAGFLMAKEIDQLGALLSKPARPFATILGGAKISSKVAVLRNLLPRIDCLLLGGGIATTFLKALGNDVGDSLVEQDYVDTARDVLRQAEQLGVPVLLPTDLVVAQRFAADSEAKTVGVGSIEPGWRAMDIGPDTLGTYLDALSDCKTIFWNGPLGVAEFSAFAEGSLSLALALADLDTTVVVGGGETAAMVEQAGLRERFTHVSTGGGASLEFLEGVELPGVAVLLDA
jgi:phosphoglycerate kinase